MACLCSGYVVVFIRMLSYLCAADEYEYEYEEYDVRGGTYRTMSMLLLFALPFSKARGE